MKLLDLESLFPKEHTFIEWTGHATLPPQTRGDVICKTGVSVVTLHVNFTHEAEFQSPLRLTEGLGSMYLF